MGKKGEKHVTLTHGEKVKTATWFKQSCPQPTQQQVVSWIMKQFGKQISRTTVSKMKLTETLADSDCRSEVMRAKPAMFPDFERVLFEWILRQERHGMLTDDLVTTQAEAVRDKMSITADQLNLSSGWLHRFKRRHGIKCWRKHGEAGSLNEHVLLLLDNMSAHSVDHLSLSHITVHFLPPNTTARLQPLDAGIIECLKRRYRKLFLRWRLERMEAGEESKRINLLQVTRFITDAYDQISNEIIRNCWRSTNIVAALDDEAQTETSEPDLSQDIERMRLPDPMTVNEFVSIAGEEQVCAPVDLDAVIAEVTGEPEEDDAAEHEPKPVTASEAIACLTRVRCFMEQSDKECALEIKMIRSLIASTEKMAIAAKHQSKITDFFSNTK